MGPPSREIEGCKDRGRLHEGRWHLECYDEYVRREKDVILSVCFERYEGASASVGAFLCDPTQLARLVVCRLPSLSEEVVVPVWRAFRDELRLVLGLRWVTSPPARIGRSLTLHIGTDVRVVGCYPQIRFGRLRFPDVPPASGRTPDHLSILRAPVRMEFRGFLYQTLQSSELAVSLFAKNLKRRGTNLA